MRKFPDWINKKIVKNDNIERTRDILNKHRLNTVCLNANCPNIWDCFSNLTATFMILGNNCTRNCAFCCVGHFAPEPVDKEEPLRIKKACVELGLKYVIITSVTRDDLPDKGAGHFQNTVQEIKKIEGDIRIEVLVPDFNGDEESISKAAESRPDVFSHNLETVPRLYGKIRPGALFDRSLQVLRLASKEKLVTKSSFFVGIGETKNELLEAMKDLKSTGCDMLTIGQYLKPDKTSKDVEKYYTPEEFLELKDLGHDIGFEVVESGPFVRSSYRAFESFKTLKSGGKK